MNDIYLIVRANGRPVASMFTEPEALDGAREAAERLGEVIRVAKVPVIAEFGPLSRLSDGEVPKHEHDK